jgi:hypothetical protein
MKNIEVTFRVKVSKLMFGQGMGEMRFGLFNFFLFHFVFFQNSLPSFSQVFHGNILVYILYKKSQVVCSCMNMCKTNVTNHLYSMNS